MRLPRLAGEIERRLLVNYRVDPEVVGALLPAPFRPLLVGDAAVAGIICLIRLGSMRPVGLPPWVGLRSENAAHRIAVEWDEPAGRRTGVYIPRRDTDSWLNTTVGGRLFPGEHHRARFDVSESDDEISIGYRTHDHTARVHVAARLDAGHESRHLFADLTETSAFFERGAVGYSATRTATRFDGLELSTARWQVEPALMTTAESSFFDDPAVFPPGTAELDGALLMRRVPVEWLPLERLDQATR